MTATLRIGIVLLVIVTSVFGGLALYQTLEPALAPTPVALLAAPVSNTHTSIPQQANKLQVAPLVVASATTVPLPTATAEPSATATAEVSPTPVFHPTAFPDLSTASFRAGDSGMRHNIEVAVNANGDALRHVVVAPGATFSFNSALGPRPESLPWRMVGRTGSVPAHSNVAQDVPTAGAWFVAMRVLTTTPDLDGSLFGQVTPAPEASAVLPPPSPEAPTAPPAADPQPNAPAPAASPTAPATGPTAVETPEVVFPPVLGGGVCDLASRFVVAGRKLLPPRAFRFKPHPGGISGLRNSDAVSIWATNSRRYDNDLLITNTTKRWLVFEVYLDADQVTVVAWLQDGP